KETKYRKKIVIRASIIGSHGIASRRRSSSRPQAIGRGLYFAAAGFGLFRAAEEGHGRSELQLLCREQRGDRRRRLRGRVAQRQAARAARAHVGSSRCRLAAHESLHGVGATAAFAHPFSW